MTHLYLARMLAGLAGGGVYITVSVFINDIAEDQYFFHSAMLQCDILYSV